MTVEERIYYTVGDAIAKGMTPKDFVKEVRESWKEQYRSQAANADKDFDYMLRIPLVGGAA